MFTIFCLQNSIANICKEIEPFIPADVKKFLEDLKGNEWPASGKPCLDFNAKTCESGWIHPQRGVRGKHEYSCMHICAICVKVHMIGLYHSALECPTIKRVDQKISTENRQNMMVDETGKKN